MRYRNTKTQAVIETACVISGGDWVVEDVKEAKTVTNSKRKLADKKGENKK